VTIAKGQAWGRPVPRPASVVEAASDAAVVALLERRSGPVVVTGGDLRRTLGHATRPSGALIEVPVDLIAVELDGRPVRGVAHVVARRWRGWRGPIVAVMNVEHRGDADVAPRAHPNDGALDIVEVEATMPLRARAAARRRLRTGTHVPHPDITVRRAAAGEWTFDGRLRVEVDGVDHGRVRHVRVAVLPDAATVLG
jgi:hypothetical protein